MEAIKDMTNQELREEILEHCKNTDCNDCPAYLKRRYAVAHDQINNITNRYELILMVELIRGNLVWKDQLESSGVTITHEVSELRTAEAVMPDNSTMILIAGEKPSTMTVFFGETDGEETDGQTQA